MNITNDQLIHIMPNAKSRAVIYLPYINKYMEEFKINTPLRVAHYLAQIAHESGELRYTQELASGAAYDTGRLAVRLGNTPKRDGDGEKYKGRGLIQITGFSNYKKYSKYCGYDVTLYPTLLEQPLGAVRSSMWFFAVYAGLNKYADADDIITITKKINGGLNGLSDRQKYLARAKEVIR